MPTSAALCNCLTEGPRRWVCIELKLDATDSARLLRSSLVRGSQGRTDALSTIYFDTKDFDLREAGLSLHSREVAGRRIQTIKAKNNAAAGLFNRVWRGSRRSMVTDRDLKRRRVPSSSQC